MFLISTLLIPVTSRHGDTGQGHQAEVQAGEQVMPAHRRCEDERVCSSSEGKYFPGCNRTSSEGFFELAFLGTHRDVFCSLDQPVP